MSENDYKMDDYKTEAKNTNTNKAKPPKAFKITDNIDIFIKRFELYAEINKIPKREQGPLILTLLDDVTYEIFNRVPIRNLDDYDELIEQLTNRFSPLSGKLGDLVKLKNRKQGATENDIEYLEILGSLATKAGILDQDERAQKLIELFIENAHNLKSKEIAINVQLKSQLKKRGITDSFEI